MYFNLFRCQNLEIHNFSIINTNGLDINVDLPQIKKTSTIMPPIGSTITWHYPIGYISKKKSVKSFDRTPKFINANGMCEFVILLCTNY